MSENQVDVSSLVLVQNLPLGKSEEEVRRHFSTLCGPVLWSSRLGDGDAVVLRLTDESAVVRAVSVANKSSWSGKVLLVDPCSQLMGNTASEEKTNQNLDASPDFKLSSAPKERKGGSEESEDSSANVGTAEEGSPPESLTDQSPSVATTAQLDADRMAMLQNIANLSFSPRTPTASPWASQTAILPVKSALGLPEESSCSYVGLDDPLEPVYSSMQPLTSASHEIQEGGPQQNSNMGSMMSCLSAQTSQDVHRMDPPALSGLLGQNMQSLSDDQRTLLANYLAQQMQQGQQQNQQMYIQQLLEGGSGMGPGRTSQVNSAAQPANQMDLLRSLLSADAGSYAQPPMRSSNSLNTASAAAAALLHLSGSDGDGYLSPDSRNSLASMLSMNQRPKPPLSRSSTGSKRAMSARTSLDMSTSSPMSSGHRSRNNYDPFVCNQRHKQLNHKKQSPAGSNDWNNFFQTGSVSYSAGPPVGGGGQLTPNSSAGSAQQVLSFHVLQEFSNARTMLVQLMNSAFKFLHSDAIKEFYERLTPITALYDEMHELCVVEKRSKCREMAALRQELVKEMTFNQVLNAVCSLRYHLHSLSRKLLVLNQSPDNIPIDLLIGSAGPEVYRVVKSALPTDIAEFFSNSLPNPHLAVLVFAEFTTVDPSPTPK